MNNNSRLTKTYFHKETRDETSFVRHEIFFIDPTDSKPINPEFFEKTAEEKAEQDEIAQRKVQPEQTFFVQDEFQEIFNEHDLGIPPQWLKPLSTSFYFVSNRKIAGKPLLYDQLKELYANIEKTKFDQDFVKRNYDHTNCFGKAADEITRLLVERIKADHPIKPKTKTKADYKNKVYKNTAKKAKVSPIVMALIKKTK